jgi:hypothetical protein
VLQQQQHRRCNLCASLVMSQVCSAFVCLCIFVVRARA